MELVPVNRWRWLILCFCNLVPSFRLANLLHFTHQNGLASWISTRAMAEQATGSLLLSELVFFILAPFYLKLIYLKFSTAGVWSRAVPYLDVHLLLVALPSLTHFEVSCQKINKYWRWKSELNGFLFLWMNLLFFHLCSLSPSLSYVGSFRN